MAKGADEDDDFEEEVGRFAIIVSMLRAQIPEVPAAFGCTQCKIRATVHDINDQAAPRASLETRSVTMATSSHGSQ